MRKVNDVCVVGASGELSDFQYIMRWALVGQPFLVNGLCTGRECWGHGRRCRGSRDGRHAGRRTGARNKMGKLQLPPSDAWHAGNGPAVHGGMVGSFAQGTDLSLSAPAAALPRLLEELSDDDFCMDDGHHLKPHEVHSYLCRVLYNRRNKCAGRRAGWRALSWLTDAESDACNCDGSTSWCRLEASATLGLQPSPASSILVPARLCH